MVREFVKLKRESFKACWPRVLLKQQTGVRKTDIEKAVLDVLPFLALSISLMVTKIGKKLRSGNKAGF